MKREIKYGEIEKYDDQKIILEMEKENGNIEYHYFKNDVKNKVLIPLRSKDPKLDYHDLYIGLNFYSTKIYIEANDNEAKQDNYYNNKVDSHYTSNYINCADDEETKYYCSRCGAELEYIRDAELYDEEKWRLLQLS